MDMLSTKIAIAWDCDNYPKCSDDGKMIVCVSNELPKSFIVIKTETFNSS